VGLPPYQAEELTHLGFDVVRVPVKYTNGAKPSDNVELVARRNGAGIDMEALSVFRR
jgi:ribosomal protein S16